jgi:fructoselysine 6-phosphate deglycase
MIIKEIVKDIKQKSEMDGGIRNVFFVACGGSLLALYPARYLLERESCNLSVYHLTSNEFVHALPKSLGKNSIVVLCSLGGTPETEKACHIAVDAGAFVISFCGNPDSPMSKSVNYWIPFKSIFNTETKYMESNAGPALLLAFEILEQFEGYVHYGKAIKAFSELQGACDEARSYFESRANAFAQDHKDDKLIYSLGGGPALGVAYGFSICSMMEMQWINCPLINTGEFFHGPFEIVDRTIPFVLFLSEGRNREIDERVVEFLRRYAERLTIIDAKELYINRFDDSVSEFFNHFVFDVAQRCLLSNMARIRGHEMMTRRYMWHVEY